MLLAGLEYDPVAERAVEELVEVLATVEPVEETMSLELDLIAEAAEDDLVAILAELLVVLDTEEERVARVDDPEAMPLRAALPLTLDAPLDEDPLVDVETLLLPETLVAEPLPARADLVLIPENELFVSPLLV